MSIILTPENFLEIRDINDDKMITEDLCYNCLRYFEKCSKCERK